MHLDIEKGRISAMVSGSEIYTVEITIKALPRKKWHAVKKRCAGQIGSLLELLQGRLSENVMSVVTDRAKGLFPLPKEIHLSAAALTGPSCASMWRPCFTVWAQGLTRHRSYFSCCGA